MKQAALIDVIIVNYFCAEDSIAAFTSGKPWTDCHVWIIDNSANEAEASQLQAAFEHEDKVTLIIAKQNLGFAKACNLAYQRSNSEYALLLNPDAKLHNEDLNTLYNSMTSNPHLAAVAPATYWDDNHRFLLPTLLPETPLTWLLVSLSHRWPQLGYLWSNWQIHRQQKMHASLKPQPINFLSGAILLLRRSALETMGQLFDEHYFMFYEDADLCQRLDKAHWQMALVPTASSVHHWKNGQHKVKLMRDSATQYIQCHYPLLAKMGAPDRGPFAWLQRIRSNNRYAHVLPMHIDSSDELANILQDDKVFAISPTLAGFPALFRPLGQIAVDLNQSEWQQLVPGNYVLHTENLNSKRKKRYLLTIKPKDV